MHVEREFAESALLGALIGDAAGATLEFLGRKPSREEVDKALTLPGGGYWKINPGQITDDGELTLSLARALIRSNGEFSIGEIATAYSDWYQSRPFDLGNTISNAFSTGGSKRSGVRIANAMKAQAAAFGSKSKSNGSLMRCVPLAIWGHRLRNSDIATVAHLDCELSHSNGACKDAVACYVIALASLLRNRNREEAIANAYRWILQRETEPTTWLEAAQSGIQYPAHPNAGFVRIGFQQAFFHLKAGSSYVEAIQDTLLQGGDTDTNACIVGGLLGAAEEIPQDLAEKILLTKPQGLRARPLQYTPHDARELANNLLIIAPDNLRYSGEPGILGAIKKVLGWSN